METFLIWTGLVFWIIVTTLLLLITIWAAWEITSRTSEVKKFTTRWSINGEKDAFHFKILGFGFLVLPAEGGAHEYLEQRWHLQQIIVRDKVIILVHPWRRKK